MTREEKWDDWMLWKGAEAIVLENDVVRAMVLPARGGKVASFYRKDRDFELLFQNPDEQYRAARLYDDFAAHDASGFDDCFPCVQAGPVEAGGRVVQYPDHGEVWSSRMVCTSEGEMLSLRFESAILPYTYRKTLYLSGSRLNAAYEVTNKGEFSFPCLWTMHALLCCHPDMQLHFPRGVHAVENAMESRTLGSQGALHHYPETLTPGGAVRLDRMPLPAASGMEKYYVAGRVSEGECGAYYPHADISCRIRFDIEKLPYLGFWVTAGGFRGDCNCAFEPSSGYYDSIAIARKKGALPVLTPGETLRFGVTLALEGGPYRPRAGKGEG